MWLPFLCEKSGAIALVLQGLIAGGQAVNQSASQSDNSAKFRNFKIIYRIKYSNFHYV